MCLIKKGKTLDVKLIINDSAQERVRERHGEKIQRKESKKVGEIENVRLNKRKDENKRIMRRRKRKRKTEKCVCGC